jgi:hypothetical protein
MVAMYFWWEGFLAQEAFLYEKCSASECVPKSKLLKSLNLGRQMYERKGGEKVDRRGKVTGEERRERVTRSGTVTGEKR